MAPPEIILDRWIKTQAARHPDPGKDLANYEGKLNIEQVEPPSFRAILRLVQGAMNRALQLESINASGGAAHPPFHFDYIQVRHGKAVQNAHAFQHGGFSFIVTTLPLVERLWALSHGLSRSASVRGLLGIDPGTVRLDGLQALLFQFQLSFLVSHEYTHHVHQHCDTDQNGVAGVWTEFSQKETNHDTDSQAQELDADAYAIYLVLANYLRGGGRQSSLVQLGRENLSRSDADEFLLMCFFFAVTAFFCILWPEDIKITSIGELSHPAAPVRIEYAIRVAEMWCDQNGSVSNSWFDNHRFRALFGAAAETIAGPERQAWDEHIFFLRSAESAKYRQQLFERFEALRRKQHSPIQKALART